VCTVLAPDSCMIATCTPFPSCSPPPPTLHRCSGRPRPRLWLHSVSYSSGEFQFVPARTTQRGTAGEVAGGPGHIVDPHHLASYFAAADAIVADMAALLSGLPSRGQSLPHLRVYSVVCVHRGVCTAWCVCSVVCVQRGVCTARCVYSVVCVQRGVCAAWCVYSVVCVQRGVCTAWCMYSLVCVRRWVSRCGC
jgi:hypothetical protein